jgi:Helix-turn-helix family
MYFAPEAQQAFEDAGVTGFWRGYFAGRAAPLGIAPAGMITATFYGFHPDFVARAIPSVWTLITPERAIDARLDGIDRALRRLFGDDLSAAEVGRAAAEIHGAVEGTPVTGLPLFGANAQLDWPEVPHLALWHAATLLREHRGDGHVNALGVAGVDPCEAHVLRIAADHLPVDSIQPYRGWTEQNWADATARLRDRGWLDEAGETTPAGRAGHDTIEDDTDRLSAALVERVDDPDLVMRVLTSIAEQVQRAGVVPYPNPIGVPAPEPGR